LRRLGHIRDTPPFVAADARAAAWDRQCAWALTSAVGIAI